MYFTFEPISNVVPSGSHIGKLVGLCAAAVFEEVDGTLALYT